MKCDKNLVPTIIERDVYIKRVCRDHLYQRDTYLYLPPELAVSEMAALKLNVVACIKRHPKHRTIMEKSFLTTNLQANIDTFPRFYGMTKLRKTWWAMIHIISCTGSLIHPTDEWNDSTLQHVAADKI